MKPTKCGDHVFEVDARAKGFTSTRQDHYARVAIDGQFVEAATDLTAASVTQ